MQPATFQAQEAAQPCGVADSRQSIPPAPRHSTLCCAAPAVARHHHRHYACSPPLLMLTHDSPPPHRGALRQHRPHRRLRRGLCRGEVSRTCLQEASSGLTVLWNHKNRHSSRRVRGVLQQLCALHMPALGLRPQRRPPHRPPCPLRRRSPRRRTAPRQQHSQPKKATKQKMKKMKKKSLRRHLVDPVHGRRRRWAR